MSSELNLYNELQSCVHTRDLIKFQWILDGQPNLVERLKPHLINDILQQCIRISDNTGAAKAEFVEIFMLKLYPLKCFFLFSDDACKSVVRLFITQQRQFSSYSVNCLLRCHDLGLIKRVFELNLVSDKCSGDCSNWYESNFITIYFFTKSVTQDNK